MASGSDQKTTRTASGSDTKKTLTAFDAVKSCLENVKVSKYDARKLERKLAGELLSKWEESIQVMKSTKIPAANIEPFLDYMHKAYEGIDKAMREKMNGICYSHGTWENKLVETKYNAAANSGARYAMVAFGRSKDTKYIDCIYLLYKMDFKLASKETVPTDHKSMCHSLLAWTTTADHKAHKQLDTETSNQLQNFFRLKALNGFYNEGIIDSINYVKSVDDIPELKQRK